MTSWKYYSEKNYSYVMRFVSGFGIQDPEDIVQSVFAIASIKHDQFESQSDVKTWLCAIARNCILERGREDSKTINLATVGRDQNEPISFEPEHSEDDPAWKVFNSEHLAETEGVHELFMQGLQFATEDQKTRFLATSSPFGVYQRGKAAAYARNAKVSTAAISKTVKKARDAAIAGSILVAANEKSEELFNLISSDSFSKLGPDTSETVSSFNKIIASRMISDSSSTKASLEWLFCKSSEKLISSMDRVKPSEQDLWRLRSLYLPMRLACQNLGMQAADLHNDAWNELRRRGLLRRFSQIGRELSTHGVYCSNFRGGVLDTRYNIDQGMEVGGLMIYLLGCRQSNLPFPELASGKIRPMLDLVEQSRVTKNKFTLRFLRFTKGCIVNPIYQRPGLASMILTWIDWLNENFEADSKTTIKEFGSLAKTLSMYSGKFKEGAPDEHVRFLHARDSIFKSLSMGQS